jgi:eukaryotic-like serine/threonine-protein kinase
MIGKILGHYRVLEKIGSGGMGEVYRASDERLGRDVALKILKPAVAHDQDRLRRFEQEARAAAALNHPNIVAIYDIGMHDGAPYIVSELLEGKTLRERLIEGPIPRPLRLRKVWLRHTKSASSTATSSRKTSLLTEMDGSRSSISALPSS